jgi:hypothetical protein
MATKVREPVSLTLEELRDHWERIRAHAEELRDRWERVRAHAEESINRARQIVSWAQEMKSEAMRWSPTLSAPAHLGIPVAAGRKSSRLGLGSRLA